MKEKGAGFIRYTKLPIQLQTGKSEKNAICTNPKGSGFIPFDKDDSGRSEGSPRDQKAKQHNTVSEGRNIFL